MKSTIAKKIQNLIRTVAANAMEDTSRAECSLTDLAYTSTLFAERHVWIDTMDYTAKHCITVDLEDWNDETNWDNSVLTIQLPSIESVADIVKRWTDGDTCCEDLNHCPCPSVLKRSEND
ncbi:hypothetical protein FACS1894170_04770 [Planctomycetales bacterium]|nr:hypothetical protein FACS1894170_04770 [Planctomycetales bacterium]